MPTETTADRKHDFDRGKGVTKMSSYPSCPRCRGRVALAIQLMAILFSTGSLVAASKRTDDPEGLLKRIRGAIADRLSHLPNYTCHEIVDRLFRRSGEGSLEHLDRVEFEVAFVDHTELFARPGDPRFEEDSISKVVNGGTIGNGAFASHAGALFSGDIATFKYSGSCKKEGHTTYRYDFQVPQEKSHFLLKHGSAEGIVAYKGTFWADIETFDLVRLELKVDHIPAYIGVSSVNELMHYVTVRIKESEFLLPGKSEMAAYDEVGNYSLNMISFAGCREFKGESVVTYGTPTDINSADREAPPDR